MRQEAGFSDVPSSAGRWREGDELQPRLLLIASNAIGVARRHRLLVLGALDGFAWMVSLPLSAVLHYEPSDSAIPWAVVIVAWMAAVLLHFTIGVSIRLYEGRHRFGSLEDATATTVVTALAGCLLTAGILVWPGGQPLPVGVPVIATALAILVATGLRLLLRLVMERARRPRMAKRAMIVGAGEVGTRLVRNMTTDPNSPYLPVLLVDDDPGKRHRRVSGVRVRGTTDDVADLVRDHHVASVIVAINHPQAELLRRINDQAGTAGVPVKVLPSLHELLDAGVSFRNLRDIELADLLGRHQIDINLDSIAGYLTNRRVLVTGAGGSIGSELCRQVWRFGPKELTMLDRDESALHATQLSVYGRALLDTPDVVLADIRDADWLRRVFDISKPEVVFHAAALKHLPMLEQYPDEAWKTNVVGTLNVLRAAAASGVDVFVNISTDKAANPTSVLGTSKRIAERLTATFARESQGRFVSVRFGNVLGSRGSVLTAFVDQIANDGPVTVTHPDVTRYLMTTGEAVELVIQAAAVGHGGEVLVLDMGQPVRIVDIANQLIAMSGRDIRIVFTGLRPGEKLHEELLADGESAERLVHPLVQHVAVEPLDLLDVTVDHGLHPMDAATLSQLASQGVGTALRREAAAQ